MNIFHNCQQQDLISLITQAQQAILLSCPGVYQKIAVAIVEAAQKLGNDRIWVIIDPSPLVVRQGYGNIEGLDILRDAHIQVYSAHNLRLGFIRCDNIALLFTPLSALIEETELSVNIKNGLPNGLASQAYLFNEVAFEKRNEPTSFVNAISISLEEADRITLSLAPKALEAFDCTIESPDLGFSEVSDSLLTDSELEKAKIDLEKNPPIAPVLARKIRILNSRFQFVEIEFKGSKLSQRKLSLTSKDIGVAPNHAGENLSGMWKIIGAEMDLEMNSLQEHLQEIRRTYLISLPKFGNIILGEQRPVFDKEMRNFEQVIEYNRKRLRSKVESLLDESKNRLKNLMINSYEKNPPEKLRSLSDESCFRKKQIENFVTDLLKQKYPTAEAILSKMELDWKIFNISEQIITKEGFAEAIRNTFYVDLEELVRTEEAFELKPIAQEQWHNEDRLF